MLSEYKVHLKTGKHARFKLLFCTEVGNLVIYL